MRIDCGNCGRLVRARPEDKPRGVIRQALCWSCYRIRFRRKTLPSKNRLEERTLVKFELPRLKALMLRRAAKALQVEWNLRAPTLQALMEFVAETAIEDGRHADKHAYDDLPPAKPWRRS